MKIIMIPLLLAALSSCASYHVSQSPAVNKTARWIIMPISNQSTTPMAGQQAEQILSSIMFNLGVDTDLYPENENTDLASILDQSANNKKAYEWLASQTYDYVLTGTIQEWHYKTGLDGEPAIGVTLELISVSSGKTIWKSSGSRAGWGRESVASAGHTVIENILDGLTLR
jgi:hypothetical protein